MTSLNKHGWYLFDQLPIDIKAFLWHYPYQGPHFHQWILDKLEEPGWDSQRIIEHLSEGSLLRNLGLGWDRDSALADVQRVRSANGISKPATASMASATS